jgi:hypothetical protein
MRRRRLPYGLLVPLVITTGLASRAHPGLLPAALGPYPGDALWALLVLLLIALARPGWAVARVAAAALATAFAVEFSQLWQPGWLNALRHTTPGHLVLGSTFHAPDLLAYTAGVALGAAMDRLLLLSPWCRAPASPRASAAARHVAPSA